MIHYHGTPCGGSRQDTARFLLRRHAIISFACPEDLPIAADACQSFCLDNGAFSAWKQTGKSIDFDQYYDWVNKWYRHPGFDFALIPDVIDGTEADNDTLVGNWPGEFDGVGVPVWHLNESTLRLTALADEFRMVALGSSGAWKTPGTAEWWSRIDDVMTALCGDDGRPPCRLHGLRMLAPDVFRWLPLASADSTNAAQNARLEKRFGMYVPPTRSQRMAVIADRVETYNSAPIWRSLKHPEFGLQIDPPFRLEPPADEPLRAEDKRKKDIKDLIIRAKTAAGATT